MKQTLMMRVLSRGEQIGAEKKEIVSTTSREEESVHRSVAQRSRSGMEGEETDENANLIEDNTPSRTFAEVVERGADKKESDKEEGTEKTASSGERENPTNKKEENKGRRNKRTGKDSFTLTELTGLNPEVSKEFISKLTAYAVGVIKGYFGQHGSTLPPLPRGAEADKRWVYNHLLLELFRKEKAGILNGELRNPQDELDNVKTEEKETQGEEGRKSNDKRKKGI